MEEGCREGSFTAASSSRPLDEFGIVSHKGKQVFGTTFRPQKAAAFNDDLLYTVTTIEDIRQDKIVSKFSPVFKKTNDIFCQNICYCHFISTVI